MSNTNYREELLLRLYDQLWNSINVRITGIWQCIGVLGGAFVVLALVEKNIIPVDIAISIIVLLAGWLLWNVQDASYWYNRNLCIIANIEKQFLLRSDARNIHHYMVEHRPHKMITHLRIQCYLGIGIILIFIAYHLSERIVPGFSIPLREATFDLKRCIPYLTLLFVVVFLLMLRKQHKCKYKEFVSKSPGEWAAREKTEEKEGQTAQD